MSRKRPTIGLIGTVKDEAPWLIEWIAHNTVLGFDRISIASNDCSDGTDLMLDRMEELGLVRHIRNDPPYSRSIQFDAYYRLQTLPEMESCDWLMALDADEFLNIRVGEGRIHNLVALAGSAGQIPVRWRIFGDNGVKDMIDPPITEKLTSAALLEDGENDFFKCVVGVHRDYEMNNNFARVWRPHARFGWKRFRRMSLWYEHRKISFSHRSKPRSVRRRLNAISQRNEIAQINHYAIRTEALSALKLSRGTGHTDKGAQGSQAYIARLNLNASEDLSLSRYFEERRKLERQWLKDATLARLYSAAIAYTSRRLSGQTTAPDPGEGMIGSDEAR